MKKALITGIIAANLTLSGAVLAQEPSDDTDHFRDESASVGLQDLYDPRKMRGSSDVDIPEIRERLLRDTAHTVGYRAGLGARAKELRDSIERRTPVLNQVFDFSPMISNDGVLPPVIVEARDVASYDDNQIRLADHVYSIKVPERFVSNPITWRDYLYMGLPASTEVNLPRDEALPERHELPIWQKALQEGWEQGVNQADIVMTENFNRLARDFNGMLRYSVLVQQRMITLPVVAEYQQTVSGDGQELTLGERNRRLLEHSEFVVDPNLWRPSVTSDSDSRREPVQYENRYQGIDRDETRFEQYPQSDVGEQYEGRP